jgi:hypothetical protein
MWRWFHSRAHPVKHAGVCLALIDQWLVLIPAFSPGKKEKYSPFSANSQRLDSGDGRRNPKRRTEAVASPEGEGQGERGHKSNRDIGVM